MAKLVEILERDMESWEWGDYAVQRDDALVMFFNEDDGSGQPVNVSRRYEKAHPHHRTATREQWQAARDALNKPATPVIDWSKAPEGYPLWIVPLGSFSEENDADWHKEDGDYYRDASGFTWSKISEGRAFLVYRKPEEPSTPAWDGTCPPPVGAVCEALNRLKEEWLKVKILDHEGTVPTAVCRDEKNRLWWAQDFRPIRTPEQIAAEERNQAILEMCLHGVDAGDFTIEKTAAALYDAGYRKQEPK